MSSEKNKINLNTDHLAQCIKTLESKTTLDILDWQTIPEEFKVEIEKSHEIF